VRIVLLLEHAKPQRLAAADSIQIVHAGKPVFSGDRNLDHGAVQYPVGKSPKDRVPHIQLIAGELGRSRGV